MSHDPHGRLAGVHPDLVAVVERAAGKIDFRVTEGLRDLARQKRLVAEGKSRTLRSRHLTGHAVDLVALTGDGVTSYAWAEMSAIARAMKAAAEELAVPIEWGGDWTTFKDTPHFQLPWALYPAEAPHVRSASPPIIEGEPVSASPAAETKPAKGVAAEKKSPVRDAVKGSWTVQGALWALAGGVVQYAEAGVELLLEAAGEMTRLAPLSALGLDVKALGFGMTAFGVVLVVMRRLQAAKQGKIG